MRTCVTTTKRRRRFTLGTHFHYAKKTKTEIPCKQNILIGLIFYMQKSNHNTDAE